jgi:Family of unknown function (DUF6364)
METTNHIRDGGHTMAAIALTLAIEEETIRKAEQVASTNGTDLQTMVGRYLEALASASKGFDESSLPPITRSALGLFKDIPNKSYKELLTDALVEKYGLK